MYTPGRKVSWEVREWHGDATGWMTSYHKTEGSARDAFDRKTRFAKIVEVTTERHERTIKETGDGGVA